MDAGSRRPAGRPTTHELHGDLRRAVEAARTAPVPADALARAVEASQRPSPPVHLWPRWLLIGGAGRN